MNDPGTVGGSHSATANATIGDIGEFINGFAFKPSDRTEGGLPIIRIQNLTDRSKPLNRTMRQVPRKYLVNTGDLLVSWSATLDAFVWHGETALVNQHIFKVVTNGRVVNERFAYYLMKHSIGEMSRTEHLHGSTMKHINREPFLGHRVWIPSLSIQEKIANRLDDLFGMSDEGITTLDRAKSNLDRYRESLLQSAVTGSLTAEWRKANLAKEDGKALLERILRERRERWEKEQLASFAAKGTQPPKGWREKYEEPPAPDTTQLPELPEEWAWATVGQLLEERLCNGVSVKGSDTPPGVRALRLSAVTECGFDYSEHRFIPISESIASGLAIQDGELFVVRGNGSLHLVGRSVLAKSPPPMTVFPDTMIRLRISSAPTVPEFVNHAWKSRVIRQQIERAARTTAGIYKISQGDIENLTIPLPPLFEQQHINALLRLLLSATSSTTFEVDESLRRSNSLLQSILKAAFEGRLVPQDPNEEPASALLERIKAKSSAVTATKTKITKRRKAAAK